ncbi:MAG TPA: tRNA guanosine(34) transglycosylase Tgt [Candidatus Woesebacteria bacterium]|nr:tRNA guanosine(34) transglycosylase Tgt [Candidatus Woesebacteria bacterium]
MKPSFFKTITGQQIPLPVFFPDATRAVLKTLDSTDIASTKTPGVLVNTFHLYNTPGGSVIKEHQGVRNFMNWNGGCISDSGGFQVMSVAKQFSGNDSVTDKGVTFKLPGTTKKIIFTPQISIDFQFILKTDMVVVLDDFTDLQANEQRQRETVERTIKWAKECKKIFVKNCEQRKLPPEKRPYLLGVVQGGHNLELRRECTERLVEIGFDGLGYGGWPMTDDGDFNFDIPKVIGENCPDDYLLYGLGVGKPQEIVQMVKMGWNVFDCVLPTRDARHKRLYVYNADTIDHIDVNQDKFYSYFVPDKEKYYHDQLPVSGACDCLLCQHYTRAYLRHLFSIGEMTSGRLATIHNLRFYSILMEKLRPIYEKVSQP